MLEICHNNPIKKIDVHRAEAIYQKHNERLRDKSFPFIPTSLKICKDQQFYERTEWIEVQAKSYYDISLICLSTP